MDKSRVAFLLPFGQRHPGLDAEEALAQLDALTLSGTLNYQACDDKICFEPVSLPLSFTLDLDLLDRQRVNR